jgi:hypothetical protein
MGFRETHGRPSSATSLHEAPSTMTDLTRALLRLGGALVLAATISACGGAAASSPPASADVPVAATPAPSAPETGGAESATPDSSPSASFVVPTLTATTPLVDVLPEEIGGETTQRNALVGSDLSAIQPEAAMVFGSLLNVLGSPDADLTIGLASNSKSSVIAVRVAGKTAAEVGDAMIEGRTLNATTTKEDLDLGGKRVTKVVTSTATVPFYVYEAGDVSFTVAAADETLVAEALSKLP